MESINICEVSGYQHGIITHVNTAYGLSSYSRIACFAYWNSHDKGNISLMAKVNERIKIHGANQLIQTTNC